VLIKADLHYITQILLEVKFSIIIILHFRTNMSTQFAINFYCFRSDHILSPFYIYLISRALFPYSFIQKGKPNSWFTTYLGCPFCSFNWTTSILFLGGSAETDTTEMFMWKLWNQICMVFPFFYQWSPVFICLIFFHLLAQKPNVEQFSIYSYKFFNNFHMFESSFTCPGENLLIVETLSSLIKRFK
jgi:hypothetical protein